MAIEVANYQFQSWARRGISAQINEQDTLGNPAAPLPPNERASISLGVYINDAPETPKNFALVGPGDIIGIHRDMVVRTEPRNRIVNFEPNYLPFIEFYDEDFPWRYTPAKPDGDRLRPWFFLFVLKESEFKRDDHRVPLPVVQINAKEAFPPSDETWLFAHVHTEQNIAPDQLSQLEKYLVSLEQEITTDPDKIYSRLLSPRHLEPNQAYTAFLVPTFEVGRLAGLGRSTAGVSGQKPAWDSSTTGLEMPIYYDWEFRTGDKVDFESLVEILEPRVLDPKIGIRSMDCSKPGFVRVDGEGRQRPLLAGEDPGLPAPLPPVQGLEGALKTDQTESLPVAFTANQFQDELQILVNLPETIQTNINAPPGSDEDILNDPVVTIPFYGQNHARQHKTDKILLDVTKSGWYDDLNRDPRTRVPAGFGTSVIQKNQDKFMQRAWQQVQKVFEGNRIIRHTQFTMRVSLRYTAKVFSQITPDRLLAMTLPLHAKILGSPTTIRQQLSESRLSVPVLSAPFRRLTRPTGKLARRLSAKGTPLKYADLVTAVNEGKLSPAPPRAVPKEIPSVDDFAKAIQPQTFPSWVQWLMRNRVWVLAVLLIMLAVVGILTGAWAVCGIVAAAGVAGFVWLRDQSIRTEQARLLLDPPAAKTAIASVPPQPSFNIVLNGESIPPPPTPGSSPEADSVEASTFRRAAMTLQDRLIIRPPTKPPLAAFPITNGYTKTLRAIDPHLSFPLRLSAFVKLPNLSLDRPEEIVDAMAHPDFEEAMYAYLRDINKELLIPNLDLIPPNTISLLETNPKFIESYMVGLNHEMARELLWREYPTDLRGSYFRQFWEVKGINNPQTPTDAEALKDITKIHTWQSASPLGGHKPVPDSRSDVQPGDKQVVLVIRGELLKRYPNTVIYAQKAIDLGRGKVIRQSDPTPDQFATEWKFPLFRAEIDPDLRFFGFDLTIEKAKGAVDSNAFPNDKLGWFFVIQEVPGEPRFGMDISYEPNRDTDTDPTNDPSDTWDNLAWNLFGATDPTFIKRSPAPVFRKLGGSDLKTHIWAANSANLAYELFQSPVMVAVHASEMLKLAERDRA
jgi:hypothetical protein